MRGHPASADPGVYASDRLHLNTRGHAIVGSEAIRALGAAIPASARQVRAVVGSIARPISTP